jgi:cobyric acid synthase
MYSKFFLVVIVSLCYQVALADKFEGVSNTSKYQVGIQLTKKSNMEFCKDEHFSLKHKQFVVITGGEGTECEKNCKPNDWVCIAKCLATALSCVPSVFWGKSLPFLRNYSIP